MTAVDERLRSATDLQQMERATALGRIVVSADQDFLVIVADELARGASFPGLFRRSPPSGGFWGIAIARHAAESAQLQEN